MESNGVAMLSAEGKRASELSEVVGRSPALLRHAGQVYSHLIQSSNQKQLPGSQAGFHRERNFSLSVKIHVKEISGQDHKNSSG